MATSSNLAIREWAEFDSSLPDDRIEAEHGGDVVRLPGKSVADALSEVLVSLGCRVGAVRHTPEHGWDLRFKFAGRRLRCEITVSDRCLIKIEDAGFFAKLRDCPHPAYLELMRKIGPALEGDARFLNVAWFYRGELHKGLPGARHPAPEAAKDDRPAVASVRPWAEFDSTLPDDGMETEDGTDFIRMPGKNVAEALSEVLAGLGCHMEGVRDAGDHGWHFGFEFAGRSLWCQVTLIEKYLIVIEDARMRWSLDPAYVEVMRRIGPALERDGRFLNIEWFREPQPLMGAKGARYPVPEAAVA